MDALSTCWQRWSARFMCSRSFRSSRRYLRYLALALVGCVVLAGLANVAGGWRVFAAGATSRQVASARQSLPSHTSSGPQYLYLDNGGCPNSISGFQITSGGLVPTPGSPYATHACQGKPTLGANQIAVDAQNDCVFHSDEYAGMVESFSENPATGELTGPVSSLAIGDKKDNHAGDLHVATVGGVTYVFVAVWSFQHTGNLSTLVEGSGCSLTLTSQLATPNKTYYSIVPVPGKNSLELLAADYANATIDSYSANLATQGALTLQSSFLSQFPEPEGLAAWNTASDATAMVFSGIGDDYDTQAQAALLSKDSGALTASGAVNAPQNVAGPYVSFWHDGHAQLVIQSDALNNTLAVYTVANGTLVFQSEVTLPGLVTPSAQALAHDTLYVVGDSNSAVDACYLPAQPITCTQLTTLPHAGVWLPEGVGVLG